MYDINKYIANRNLGDRDPEGYLYELAQWSPRFASRLAAEEGLLLEEKHWEVICSLREHYRACGPDWMAREVTHFLETEFASKGGRHFLYQLFPQGPLAQGCRLAGLPLPHGTLDPSFGSAH